MPYVFEATFTQPLLTQLDNGTIKGAKDWANAITRGYVNTIKAGLPQGVPPVLPAPGLNPTAPPPYPIGASGFTTADSRSKLMYNVLYAYYYAKEVSLDKQAIEQLTVDVKRLIIKVKAKTLQIKTLIDTISKVNQQLSQMPKILTEIVSLLKEEVKARLQDVRLIASSLDDFKVVMTPVDFAEVFKRELALIETIKNFDILDPASIRELALFVSEYGQRTNTSVAATTDEDLMKNYVQGKLFDIAKSFIAFADGAKDPSMILNFIRSLDRDSKRVQLLYQRIKEFDVFVRFVEPKLARLRIKKDELQQELRTKLQIKLAALRSKLRMKVEEYLKKKSTGKAANLYKKATKILKDIKQKIAKKTKYYRRKIQLLTKVFNTTVKILGKTASLTEGLKVEFARIKNEIIASRKAISQTANSVQVTFDEAQMELEKQELSNYFNQMGLAKFTELGTLTIVELKCSFQTFKYFFEKQNAVLNQYVQEIIGIDNDIKDLDEALVELRDSKKKKQGVRKQSPKWKDRIKSLGSLLRLLLAKIEPAIEKIKAQVTARIDELKAYVKNYLNKVKEDIKIYAINLLPIRSDIQDKKDKSAEAKAKMNILKEKINKTKKLIELGANVTKVVKGSTTLFKNIQKGEYKLSTNQNAINFIVDGLYDSLSYDQSSAVVRSLSVEKRKTKDHFKSLMVIEALSYGLVEFFKDIKQTDFNRDFNKIIDEQLRDLKDATSVRFIQQLVSNPPTTPQQLINTLNNASVSLVLDVKASTTLLGLEKTYLSRSREVVKTLLDIKELEGSKFGKQLQALNTKLNKNQSFILLGIQLLKSAINDFLSFLEKKVQEFIDKQKAKLASKRAKIQADSTRQLKKEKDKKINIEAVAMSLAFGLAARAFWTGATWIGPTGSNHISLSIGVFKKIKAKSTDGASKMIREAAKSFEKQLNLMQGLVIPPANTGIPPIPFNGYK